MAQDPPAGFTLTAPPAPRSGGGGSAPPRGFTLTAPPQRRQQQTPVRNQRRPRAVAPADNGVDEAAGVSDSGGPAPAAAFLPGQYKDSQGEPMSPLEPGDQDYTPSPGQRSWAGTSRDPVPLDQLTTEEVLALPVGVYYVAPGMTEAEQLAAPITLGGTGGTLYPAPDGRVFRVPDPTTLLDAGEAAAAGLGRGIFKTALTAQELLGQGLSMLPAQRGGNNLEGLITGQQNAPQGLAGWLVNNAREGKARLDADVQRYRDSPITNFAMQAGTVGGELAVTVPAGGAIGRGITAGGTAVARFAPGVGNAMARIGQSTSAGGFLPRAAQYAETNPTFASRAADLATRATGGAISGGVQTALVDPEDAQMGAAIGAFIPTIGAQVGRAALRPLLDGYDMLTRRIGPARAARIFRESLGIDYDAAVTALQNAPEGVTARQALVEAGVEPRVFMAVGREAERGGGAPVFGAIAERQAANRQTTLNRMAGGESVVAREEGVNAMRGALNQDTALPRGIALAQADASGASLDVEPIADHLLGLASARGTRADPVMPSVLATVAQRLRNAAALNDGVIAAADLYRIRQTVGDDIKAALVTRTGALTDASDRRIGGLLSSVQPLIDDAIETAGGSGWRRYLEDFGAGARAIERQALMGEAARRHADDTNAFRALVRGDAPDAVGVASGGRTRNINAMLGPGATAGPSRMDALDRFAGELARDERVGQLAADPQAVVEARALLDRSKHPAQQAFGAVARFLSPRTAAAEAFASMLAEQRIGQDVRRALAEGYQSGASALDLLAMVPTRERAQVARNMANPAFWRSVQGAGVSAGRSVRDWLNRRPENANRMAIGSAGDVPSNAMAQ